MRKTLHFSKVTQIDYEFSVDDMMAALIGHFKISVTDNAKVSIEVYDADENGMGERVELRIKYTDEIIPEVSKNATGHYLPEIEKVKDASDDGCRDQATHTA
jgi:hypothetical protein